MSDIWHENQVIAGGGSGSGGHKILNASGQEVTQRSKLQFGKSVITDDATNDITKINVNNAVEISWADYQALSQAEKEDGTVYYIPDYPGYGGVYYFATKAAMDAAIGNGDVPDGAICMTGDDTPYVVSAAETTYDNTDSGLDATDVQGAIDEVTSNFQSTFSSAMLQAFGRDVSISFSVSLPKNKTLSLTDAKYYNGSNWTTINTSTNPLTLRCRIGYLVVYCFNGLIVDNPSMIELTGSIVDV